MVEKDRDVFDKAREQTQKVQRKAESSMQDAKARYELAKQRMSEQTEKVADYIAENPIRSILIAAGVGAVIGSLFSMSRRR